MAERKINHAFLNFGNTTKEMVDLLEKLEFELRKEF